MAKPFLSVLLVATLGADSARAQFLSGGQTPTERPFTIVKLDPALDQIIEPGTMPELIGDRFGLTEGSVWIQEGASGHLLFSDMLDNVICTTNLTFGDADGKTLDVTACMDVYRIRLNVAGGRRSIAGR